MQSSNRSDSSSRQEPRWWSPQRSYASDRQILAAARARDERARAERRTAGSWKFEGWPSTILRLEKVPGVPNDRMLCFEKVRAPGFGLPEKLQIRLSDAGYLPIADEEPSKTAGEMLAVQLLREAGGQLRRQELIERIQQRGSVKLRAAAGYVGKAKQAGLMTSTEDGRESIYRLAEDAR